MFPTGDLNADTTKSLILVILAGIGGALSYIWRTTKAGKKIQFFRVCLSATLVAFICFHLGFIYAELGISERMSWALNGFSSVIGVEVLMNLISRLVLKFMKVDENDIVIKELIDSGWTPPNQSSFSGLAKSSGRKQVVTNSTGPNSSTDAS